MKLSHAIRDELHLVVNKSVYWTDSTRMLKCIHNQTKRFHTVESNCLTIIHDSSTPQEWRYVNRDGNPADDGSKGLKLGALIKNDRWLIGPEFLWEDEARWPNMIDIPCVKDDDPEIRKQSQVYTASVSREVMGEVIKYYWWKLKVMVSWLLCYKQYLRNKALQCTGGSQSNYKLVERRGCLLVEELQEAEDEILCYIQEGVSGSTNSPISAYHRSACKVSEEVNEESGRFSEQGESKNREWAVASRRPYREDTLVIRVETPGDITLQTSSHRFNNQGPSSKNGAPRPGVSLSSSRKKY